MERAVDLTLDLACEYADQLVPRVYNLPFWAVR